MADRAEYNSLVSQKDTTRSQYNACENRIGDYEYLIRQLKRKKETVTELKKSYKTHKKTTKEIHEEDHKWTGSTYKSFSKKMDAVETADEDYYTNSLDYVLDSINNEITRLENLKRDDSNLLGWLGNKLNSLINKIENYWN